jgi:hypothetical protein
MQIDKPLPPFVRFEQVPVEDRAASLEAGRRITKDVDMAFIMQRGAKDVVEKVATEWLDQIKRKAAEGAYDPEWADGYARKYEQWKKGIEMEVTPGHTSIRLVPFLSPSQVLNYIEGGITSLEELAQMSEQAMMNFGTGSRDHKAEAIKHLEANKGTDKLRDEIAELKAQIAALMEAKEDKRSKSPK